MTQDEDVICVMKVVVVQYCCLFSLQRYRGVLQISKVTVYTLEVIFFVCLFWHMQKKCN